MIQQVFSYAIYKYYKRSCGNVSLKKEATLYFGTSQFPQAIICHPSGTHPRVARVLVAVYEVVVVVVVTQQSIILASRSEISSSSSSTNWLKYERYFEQNEMIFSTFPIHQRPNYVVFAPCLGKFLLHFQCSTFWNLQSKKYINLD